MESFYNIIQKGKSICRHIVSSMFDSNNPETAVEHLLKSTERDYIIEEQNKSSETYPSLYSEPSNDFYMESDNIDNKTNEHEGDKEQTGKDNTPPMQEVRTNKNDEMRLVSEMAHLFEELNQLNSQTDDENAKSIIKYCKNRIVEILLSNGCEYIDNDLLFDNSRHIPSPFTFLPNGCPIDETIEPGVCYKEKVLIKAIVKCKL